MELNKKAIKAVFFGVAGCILLYWILHETEKLTAAYKVVSGVLSPFVIGSVLAFILNVPMRRFERMLTAIKHLKLRRVVALLLTLLAVLIVLTIVFSLLIPQVAATAETFAARLPAFYTNVETKIMTFLEEHPEIQEWVVNNTDFEKIDWVGLVQNLFTMLGDSVETIMLGAVSAIGNVFDIVFNLFISIVFGIYCLFQKETLARQGRKLLYSVASEKFADETENHYYTYAALTARALKAQHVVVARSGIGIYRNYNGPKTGNADCMPRMYDQTLFGVETEKWDFTRYTPDVVCVNLGTNDVSTEPYDKTMLENAYRDFYYTLRAKYPNAKIVFLSGCAMVGQKLEHMQYAMDGVVRQARLKGDTQVYRFDLSHQTGDLGYGAAWHPSKWQQEKMAGELTAYLRGLMKWF